ncbi:MAG: MATE family efflux transporter [Oscillospiraceae bacterium]
MNKIQKRDTLFMLTWPIFVELLLQMLMGNIDQIMISHYSSTAVAAVGNANQILAFLTLGFDVLCQASIILITQYKGAGNEKNTETMYSLAVATNLAVSGFISVIILVFNKSFLRLMSVPADVLPEASQYMAIVGGFIFLQAITMTFSAILRSNKFMMQGMIATVFMNVLNVIGNAILINGVGSIPALGVTGVAISTTISRFVGVLLMIYMFRKKISVKLNIKLLKPFPTELLKKLLGIGLPSVGENVAYDFSQIVIMSFINMFGTTTITTKVYTSMLVIITYVFTIAVVQATQVMIGHMLGAKKVDDVNKRVWKTLFVSMGSALVISSILLIFSDSLFGLFTNDPEVLKLGKTILFIDLFLEQGRAGNICFVRCLQTTGDIKFPVALGMISAWGVAVLLSYILGVRMNMGLAGIWIAMACDEIFRAIIFIFRWKSGGWKQNNLVD